MKLSRNPVSESNAYGLQLETGDYIEVVFNPDGINSIKGSYAKSLALSIGTITFPNGDMGLRVLLNDEYLYKDVPVKGHMPSFVLCQKLGVTRAEFVLNKENPRIEVYISPVEI